ncbi:glycosyltransferase family 2 protein [Epilithonimonas sp.]|uniref:glycosyltransferase family 2 protein n=1 Tax=Epilithonimonas sp. TaxID=2894511 RepID=UPI00289EC473|nr:glycosyltransferase family 2 protein [Epilithonimonas sp.]
MRKVFCIIVTYNGEKWIRECLSTINETQIQLEIVIVDNNSSDETVKIIQDEFPDVRLIASKKNLGFGGANNLGYNLAFENGAEFIYLLNQDTISYPESICNLIRIMDNDHVVGVASPMHLNDHGTRLDKKFEQYITAASCPNYISDLSLKKRRSYYEIGFVNAAAWLIKVEVVNELGGLFSSAFYHYGEDSNFLSRIRYHKKKCIIVPDVYIHHLREERGGKMSPEFEKRIISIKKVEIMMNINVSFKKSVSILYKYAGQQFFKGNIKSGLELLFYPILSMKRIKTFRSSYRSSKII